MDEARRITDRQLGRMERKIKKIYKKAAKDIVAKWNAYMERSERALKPLQDAYDVAVLSGDKNAVESARDALAAEIRKRTLNNTRYKNMIAETTRQLANVNKTALAYINGQVPDIYAVNYNAISTDAFNLGVDFAIVDAHTVKRLITDGDISLPPKKFSVPKDMRWNTKQLNASVLQGILQGEGIPKISKRIQPIINKNRASAIRNARTMVTGAECRGRLDSYYDLDKMGIVQEKEWVATADDRTRPSHLDMDGESVDIDATFSNGCMFPGDTNADPSEVWCCRCSIRSRIIGFRRADGSVSKIDYKRSEGLHNKQIREEQERRADNGQQ